MRNKYDKYSLQAMSVALKNRKKRGKIIRRGSYPRTGAAGTGPAPLENSSPPVPEIIGAGYDPELLFVECARCGAPVLWEPGRATSLLQQAGVDPAELDASCILVTDACPACGARDEYNVRIFRVGDSQSPGLPPLRGHA